MDTIVGMQILRLWRDIRKPHELLKNLLYEIKLLIKNPPRPRPSSKRLETQRLRSAVSIISPERPAFSGNKF